MERNFMFDSDKEYQDYQDGMEKEEKRKQKEFIYKEQIEFAKEKHPILFETFLNLGIDSAKSALCVAAICKLYPELPQEFKTSSRRKSCTQSMNDELIALYEKSKADVKRKC